MRTLHFGLRVADLDRSLAFYTAVGYEVDREPFPSPRSGDLTMLKLPDDDFVTIELVSRRPAGGAPGGSGLNHFVIKVESLAATTADLAGRGPRRGAARRRQRTDDFLTTWITDPDGNRIELVQWPAGHADGITAADWPG